MARLEIPVNPVFSSSTFSIALEGIRYRMRTYFSFRQQIWMLDIMDADDNDILSGIKLVPDYPLLKIFNLDGLPPGELEAIDTSGKGVPPGRYDIGPNRRVRLVYTESV